MKIGLNIFFFCILLFSFSSCTVGRFFVYNFADIQDHKKFPSRPLIGHASPFVFPKATRPRYPRFITYPAEAPEQSFEAFLSKSKTVAFLIIYKDSIHYEGYFHGYDQNRWVPSFSMAKSVTSILIGCAIQDGFIQSVQDPVTRYVPELNKNGFDAVTLLHLLQMTSGLRFNESYVNPFGHAASFYYGRYLNKSSAKLRLKHAPGLGWDYVSGNTQLLGLVLARALKSKTITEYAQEKLWTPLAMESPASWSTDRKNQGMEKTFCCLNATARDFAKIGRLYMHKGNWNGLQIVPEDWVYESTRLDTTAGSVPFYQYQWWLPQPGQDFMAQGILGQYIYVHPEKELLLVRLGKAEGNVDWTSIFVQFANQYK
jgi:CubicO group peptidase (beta-lactamase class C family)